MSNEKQEKQEKPPELPSLGWIHKRLPHCALVNFVSIDGVVNYRIKGERKSRYSKRENFLKNWRNLNTEAEEIEQMIADNRNAARDALHRALEPKGTKP